MSPLGPGGAGAYPVATSPIAGGGGGSGANRVRDRLRDHSQTIDRCNMQSPLSPVGVTVKGRELRASPFLFGFGAENIRGNARLVQAGPNSTEDESPRSSTAVSPSSHISGGSNGSGSGSSSRNRNRNSNSNSSSSSSHWLDPIRVTEQQQLVERAVRDDLSGAVDGLTAQTISLRELLRDIRRVVAMAGVATWHPHAGESFGGTKRCSQGHVSPIGVETGNSSRASGESALMGLITADQTESVGGAVRDHLAEWKQSDKATALQKQRHRRQKHTAAGEDESEGGEESQASALAAIASLPFYKALGPSVLGTSSQKRVSEQLAATVTGIGGGEGEGGEGNGGDGTGPLSATAPPVAPKFARAAAVASSLSATTQPLMLPSQSALPTFTSATSPAVNALLAQLVRRRTLPRPRSGYKTRRQRQVEKMIKGVERTAMGAALVEDSSRDWLPGRKNSPWTTFEPREAVFLGSGTALSGRGRGKMDKHFSVIGSNQTASSSSSSSSSADGGGGYNKSGGRCSPLKSTRPSSARVVMLEDSLHVINSPRYRRATPMSSTSHWFLPREPTCANHLKVGHGMRSQSKFNGIAEGSLSSTSTASGLQRTMSAHELLS